MALRVEQLLHGDCRGWRARAEHGLGLGQAASKAVRRGVFPDRGRRAARPPRGRATWRDASLRPACSPIEGDHRRSNVREWTVPGRDAQASVRVHLGACGPPSYRSSRVHKDSVRSRFRLSPRAGCGRCREPRRFVSRLPSYERYIVPQNADRARAKHRGAAREGHDSPLLWGDGLLKGAPNLTSAWRNRYSSLAASLQSGANAPLGRTTHSSARRPRGSAIWSSAVGCTTIHPVQSE
jgi:hypothetical protein